MSVPHEPSRALVQLLEVAIGLKAVVASISHYHVAIRGQCQALWAIQWLCSRVDIGQEGTRAVEYLGKKWRMEAEVKSGREEAVWGGAEARKKPHSPGFGYCPSRPQ